MATTGSLKVNRLALIEALEQAKTRIINERNESEKAWAQYDKYMKAWAQAVLKQAKTSANPQLIYGGYDTSRIEIKVPADMPAPEKPKVDALFDKSCRGEGRRGEYISLSDYIARQLNEIDNTIKLLNLCAEESVNTSVYKSVSQYL